MLEEQRVTLAVARKGSMGTRDWQVSRSQVIHPDPESHLGEWTALWWAWERSVDKLAIPARPF